MCLVVVGGFMVKNKLKSLKNGLKIRLKKAGK